MRVSSLLKAESGPAKIQTHEPTTFWVVSECFTVMSLAMVLYVSR